MHRHEHHSGEAEEALQDINKKTGRNMPQAVATAIVLIVLILACLLIRIDVFVALIVVFMLLALWELRVDFAAAGLRFPLVITGVCSAVTLLTTYYAPDPILAAAVCLTASVPLVIIGANVSLSTSVRLASAVAGKLNQGGGASAGSGSVPAAPAYRRLDNVALAVFTVLYIPALASCIVLPLTFNAHAVAHAVIIVFLPAISDTGGLFAGAWLGRHKLSPRISPKKSVEGLAGSILASVLGAYVVFAVTYGSLWASRWWVPILMGAMVGVVGTFGDLCASMLKRDIGIKDMGHLLKGHGGVMDRVDSILLCAPFLAALLWATGL
ncbi:phosphatidate cytidylyltransferase [Bifidobacterium sp.]|jgi:phosphatidate cytidylyltransferase|uniref:phosphatidate cytidylyltransferase n=1 Tax=Bifidobacterium sp. TaxID=41200 RepID=UPI0025C221B8|nr:phosphatidate cytidylyltransferase [Bifidobacterium sp.]MCH4208576.1 phosphatidate cytidylyltransferase [Bifidobacterium sp.]MCI1224262.1 phosphatidate cytidylyltransferase [Bifidobacterium sp.]